jgi:hypothetical protein
MPQADGEASFDEYDKDIVHVMGPSRYSCQYRRIIDRMTVRALVGGGAGTLSELMHAFQNKNCLAIVMRGMGGSGEYADRSDFDTRRADAVIGADTVGWCRSSLS